MVWFTEEHRDLNDHAEVVNFPTVSIKGKLYLFIQSDQRC